MPAYGDVVARFTAPFPRNHDNFAINAFQTQHALRNALVELSMKTLKEGRGSRIGKLASEELFIYTLLNANVSQGFNLEVATIFLNIYIACKRPLDITGTRIVALDEVAVISVHEAHDRRQIRSGLRM